MTFSPSTSGSTRLGGRQEIGTFGIKSSVRKRSTMEFTNKEEEENTMNHNLNFKLGEIK